tara:strand:+ start:917 stop:1081 length:165 start_codon:yes stop_codon:yes gene_type:complete
MTCSCNEAFLEIRYDCFNWNEEVHHDLIGLELIQDALLKALKEVNKRIIKGVEE